MNRNRLLASAATLAVALVLPVAAVAQAVTQDSGSATQAQKVAQTPPAPDAGTGQPPQTPPPPVFDNFIELGAKYQSEHSFKFGQYNGSPDSGGYALGAFLVRSRDPWNSGGTMYFEAGGRDLDISEHQTMPNAYAYAKGGLQGVFGLNVYLDRTAYFQSDNFHTIYGTSGGLSSAIRGGAVTGLTAANGENKSALLSPFLNVMQVGTQRTKVGGAGTIELGSGWSFTAGVDHEHKDGFKEQSLLFGSGKGANIQGYNGINPGFPGTAGAPACAAAPNNVNCAPARNQGDLVYFPEPVDYDTDTYTAKLNYQSERLQAFASYVFSQFTDNNLSFNAADPFPGFSTALIGGVGGSSASGAGNKLTSADTLASGAKVNAAFALPPSNSAHQFKGEIAYNITPTTRINGNVAYSLELQNDKLAPMTLNFNSTSIPGLPISSLDGRVQTVFGNVSITSRPIDGLDLRASYTIDDRDNETQRHLINFIENDRLSTAPSAWTLGVLTAPYSFVNQTWRAEGAYKIMPELKATAGVEYENRTRTFAESDHSKEIKEYARLNSNLWGLGDASLSYTHSVRRADNFCGICGWASLNHIENQRNLMSYNLASRTRDEVKAMVSVQPMDDTSVSFVGKFYNNNYPNTVVGLTNSHNVEAGLDVAYQPTSAISAHAFYNFEEIFFDQRGLQSPSTPSAFNNVPWKAGTTNHVHTAGVEGTWQATDELRFGANYNLSYGNTAYLIADGNGIILSPAQKTGANLATQLLYNIVPLPDVKSILNSISVHAEWAFRSNMSLWVGYTYQRFISNDWLNSVPATFYGNGLLSGDANPSYSVHVIGAAVRYKW
jgi:MtrB/PioB family decaheme-associated outer membrane protein